MAKSCMITLLVEDVGEPGGAVTVRAFLPVRSEAPGRKPAEREARFCVDTLDEGMTNVRDLIARELGWISKVTGPMPIVRAPAQEDAP